jgi:hypothetical protein
LTLATVLALTVTGLTACSSKVGQAAVVGSHRISESQVSKYINPKGPTSTTAAGNTPTPPRVFILDTLIQSELFRAALAHTKGGVPSEEALSAYHDLAAEKIIGAPIGGAAFDTEYIKQFTELGYEPSIEPVVLQAAELEYVLVTRIKAVSLADVVKAVDASHTSVSLSPRFGTWKSSALSIDASTSAGLPSYVKFGSDTQATAAAATPAPTQ